METISTGYKQVLHQQFLKAFPELNKKISEQTLIDQKRVIINHKRLTTMELEKIKNEVANELQISNTILTRDQEPQNTK